MGGQLKRLKVLLSAYACEPGLGSEPGVGWNVAREMARYHDVWVLTRANNRPAIEAELLKNPIPHARFVYYDLPMWARWWKRGPRGVQLYYYLWQIGAYFVARKIHREVGFDLVHHVTFVKYWVPSFLSMLPVPFIWGPVGGGESAPKAFWPSFGVRGLLYEALRELARWLGEHDPFVRLTARRATFAMATTQETADRLARLGTKRVEVFSQVGLLEAERRMLGELPSPPSAPVRFVSVGNLLHLKGLHLSIAALAESGLHDVEYWVIGSGPERRRLERLARRLGVAGQVKFFGKLPRAEVLQRLGECHVLIHPGLHDSGGWVSVEAMAAGRPVICLDLGGPANQVTEETGIKVPAFNPRQAVRDLAAEMRRLVEDPSIRQNMGRMGIERVREVYVWDKKAIAISAMYQTALQRSDK